MMLSGQKSWCIRVGIYLEKSGEFKLIFKKENEEERINSFFFGFPRATLEICVKAKDNLNLYHIRP